MNALHSTATVLRSPLWPPRLAVPPWCCPVISKAEYWRGIFPSRSPLLCVFGGRDKEKRRGEREEKEKEKRDKRREREREREREEEEGEEEGFPSSLCLLSLCGTLFVAFLFCFCSFIDFLFASGAPVNEVCTQSFDAPVTSLVRVLCE